MIENMLSHSYELYRKHEDYEYVCIIVSNCVKWCQIVSNGVKLCQIVSNCVKLCQIVSNCAK